MSIEDQMHLIGIVLGWIIAAGYLWLALNYFVKLKHPRTVVAGQPPAAAGRRRSGAFRSAVIRSHAYVPLFLLTVILLHVLMELIHVGFFLTGVITVSLLTVQILLGLYGAYVKKKIRGGWFYAHRTVAALLFVAIAAHVTTVLILNP